MGKLNTCLLLIIIFYLSSAASPSPQEIEAKRITFRDQSGKIRLELVVDDRSAGDAIARTGIKMYDDDGKSSASFMMNPNGPSISMHASAKDMLALSQKVGASSETNEFGKQLSNVVMNDWIAISPGLEGISFVGDGKNDVYIPRQHSDLRWQSAGIAG